MHVKYHNSVEIHHQKIQNGLYKDNRNEGIPYFLSVSFSKQLTDHMTHNSNTRHPPWAISYQGTRTIWIKSIQMLCLRINASA